MRPFSTPGPHVQKSLTLQGNAGRGRGASPQVRLGPGVAIFGSLTGVSDEPPRFDPCRSGADRAGGRRFGATRGQAVGRSSRDARRQRHRHARTHAQPLISGRARLALDESRRRRGGAPLAAALGLSAAARSTLTHARKQSAVWEPRLRSEGNLVIHVGREALLWPAPLGLAAAVGSAAAIETTAPRPAAFVALVGLAHAATAIAGIEHG